MSASGPVLAIGWDAAEWSLVERLMAEGRLPALAALRAQGCAGGLGTEPLLFAGGVWPTVYTGKYVPWHGIYQNRLWRADRMRFAMADAGWLDERPFWERLDPRVRIAVVDMPMTIAPPRPINGVHLAGWGTHDLLAPGSHPPDLWRQLRSAFGRPQLAPDLFGPQNVQSLLQLRSSLLAATEQTTRICEWLLATGDWDLFLVVLGAPHRAGHYLWDLSQVDTAGTSADILRQLGSTLTDVYQACDRAVARLMERAPANAQTLVFAAHGMGPNSGWADRLPGILSGLRGDSSSSLDLAYRLKQVLPSFARRTLGAALPPKVRDRVRAPWQVLRGHWRKTRWFVLDMDHAGYLRVNLIGRERHGIVAPGEEYDRLCDELAAMLQDVRELTSGRPIVDRIYRVADLAPPDAPYRDLLPDLVITWGDVTAIGSPGVRLAGVGEVRWPDPVKLPSGRAGNHLGRGWFVAAGSGIRAGTHAADHDLVDLVPTLTRWLGVDCPADVQGEPIPELTGTAAPMACDSEA